jgi:hypothetical protein
VARLLEMTVDSSGFSTATVDASLFSVPVGFKAKAPIKGPVSKVEETLPAGRRR